MTPTRCVLFLALALAAGCVRHDNADTPRDGDQGRTKDDPAAQAAAKKYLMLYQPGATGSITEVRKGAKDGDEVVVIGQVGGSDKPFTEGRAAFQLVDVSLKPGEWDCPWDFCDTPRQELVAARVHVKLVDGDGKTLRHDARQMFGIKELSRVVVQARVSRDKADNVVLVATGVFVPAEKN